MNIRPSHRSYKNSNPMRGRDTKTQTKIHINSDKMHRKQLLRSIHVILIYFLLFNSQACARKDETTTTTTTTPISDDMTEEQLRDIRKGYKAMAMERLFDIKGKPSQDPPKNSNTKLFVPSAMLKQYIGYRDEVREVVPDDRDFYGKINIDGIGSHENMWTAHIGDYDVEVDMPSGDEGLDSENFRGEDASHIALLPLARDPEEVPPNIAAAFPPYDHREYVTVHLKYNLSQEIYTSPTAASDFRRAKLRLTREKINNCDSNDCTKLPKPFFKNQEDRSEKIHKLEDNPSESQKLPRYQKVSILRMSGYDQFGGPHVHIFDARTIDTTKTKPLLFDITEIVREWLENPKTNYGIYVRIANLNEGEASFTRPRKSKRDATMTNASDIAPRSFPSEMGVLEHVRLKRAFRFKSDTREMWLEKQPSLLIWSKPERTEPARRHVKRHHSEGDMQADEPDTTTADYQQTTTIAHSGSGATQHSSHLPHIDKSPDATSSGSHTRRDHVPTPSSSSTRRGTQPPRASSGGRTSSQQNSRPKAKNRPAVKPSDKCSKRTLNINFDEVGWSSWIIAPHSYYANYCSGDCNWPLSDTQNSTNHAIIQSIYRSVGRLVPKSCCAPVKLGRMAILYQLDGIVQMRLYDDMIVEACGCL